MCDVYPLIYSLSLYSYYGISISRNIFLSTVSAVSGPRVLTIIPVMLLHRMGDILLLTTYDSKDSENISQSTYLNRHISIVNISKR